MARVKGDSLRVLHVIPSMGYGGAERQAAYLARGLAALGHEVHFALFAGGENLPLLERSGARVHRLSARPNHDPRRFFELARTVDQVGPDLIQTWLNLANVLGGLVALRAGLPWVYAERSLPDVYPSWKARFDRWLARRFAGAVVSNSQAADASWRRMLPPDRPRCVIRNALPLEELDPVCAADPTELGLPPELPLVVWVGRMDRPKGIDTVLDALERLNAERPVAALLIGAGELYDSVCARLRAPALAGRAVAPGRRHDVAAWLKRAAVFVSLSRYEGMPNAVMEAIGTGCPVVVSDISQHRELLDDESALFVPPGDAAATAAAIRQTLDGRAEATARAARARRVADGWSIEATSREWAALYAQLAR